MERGLWAPFLFATQTPAGRRGKLASALALGSSLAWAWAWAWALGFGLGFGLLLAPFSRLRGNKGPAPAKAGVPAGRMGGALDFAFAPLSRHLGRSPPADQQCPPLRHRQDTIRAVSQALHPNKKRPRHRGRRTSITATQELRNSAYSACTTGVHSRCTDNC